MVFSRLSAALSNSVRSRRIARHAGVCATSHWLRTELLEQKILLTAGDLDPSFGVGGQVETEFDDTSTWGRTAVASARQNDGKIVAAGEGAIARYLPDGSLDVTFGVDGRVAFPYYARSLAIQTDGKLVVAGGTDDLSSQDFIVARYLTNGTLDNSFDGDGFVITDLGSTVETAHNVAIQSNGRIVVVGGSNDSIAVARYNTDGTLDSSFDGDGRFVRRFNSNLSDTAYAVAIQTNGRIVVAGSSWASYDENPPARDFFVIRLNAGGSLDRTWDTDGYLRTTFSSDVLRTQEARDISIQADGKIIVSGGAHLNFRHYLAIARYNTDGSLDSSFDRDGRVVINTSGVSNQPIGGGESLSLQTNGRMISMANGSVYRFNANGSLDTSFDLDGIALFGGVVKTSFIQPDGRIVVGGTKNGYFGLVRFNSDGSLDSGFSADGSVNTVFGSTFDEAGRSAIQPDGRIIVAGTSALGFGISRYLVNGSLDTNFSQDGKTVIDFGPATTDAKAYDVAIQPDGKIVVAGSVRTVIGQIGFSDFALVRLNPDGSPDLSFSGDGAVTTSIGGYGNARSVAIQSDGRLVVAGDSQDGYFTVVRYNTDGSLDRTFGGDGIVATNSPDQRSVSLNDIILLPDGKILAVGSFYPAVTGQYDSTLMMVRYNADGSLDRTFGTNGRVFDSGNVQRTGNDAELLADGTFLVAGDTRRPNSSFYSKMAVTRYNSNGTVYGPFGTVVHTFSYQSSFQNFGTFELNSSATSLLVQPDGKIVLGGKSLGSFALVRMNSDGTLDTSFNSDGKLLTAFGTGESSLTDLLQQSNGRLIAVGSRRTPSYGTFFDSDFVLARYLNPAESDASTLVTINSAGHVEISDLWSRDDFLEIRRVNETLVITDTTADSHAKFRVTGAPGVLGDGTKQIIIPLSLVQLTGKSLIISGRAGDDTLTVAGDAEIVPLTGFVFHGGAGSDKLSQESSTLTSTWTVSSSGHGSVTPSGHRLRRFSSVEHFVGGAAVDVFRVSIGASSAPLKLNGSGGDNRVELSADADIVLSNAGLAAGESRLSVNGAVSQQVLLRGFQDATLTGGAGPNRFDASGFGGRVRLFGREGNDVLLGSEENDILDGGDGDDFLLGYFGDDILRGGNGNDILNGEENNDLLYGDAGNDILVGGHGADVLFGGSGEDILIGGLVTFFERYSSSTIRDAMSAAWSSAASYADRVVLLRDTGVAGSSKLTPGSTVLNDDEIDTLFGESGLDWFFASIAPATNEVGLLTGGLQGLDPGEVLTLLL